MDTVEISFCLSCTVKREAKDMWVTGCPALDLYSQGTTEEEAKRCIEEAISLWVEDCIERGTLDEALQEVGFHKIHSSALRPGDDHIAIHPVREGHRPQQQKDHGLTTAEFDDLLDQVRSKK